MSSRDTHAFCKLCLEEGVRKPRRGTVYLNGKLLCTFHYKREILLRNLNEIAQLAKEVTERVKGKVAPEFSDYHVLKALLTLSTKAPIDRKTLSNILGIGEASVRTLINRLKEKNLVIVRKRLGCFPTDRCLSLISRWKSVVSTTNNLNLGDLALDRFNSCACLREGGILIEDHHTIILRDLMIKNGASAALIIKAQKGKIRIPMVEKENFKGLTEIKRVFVPRNNDLILISYAKDIINSEKALFKTIFSITEVRELKGRK